VLFGDFDFLTCAFRGSPLAGHHWPAAFALSAFRLSPFAFRLSPFAFRLSPFALSAFRFPRFAFRLSPPAFHFLVSAPRPARVVLSR